MPAMWRTTEPDLLVFLDAEPETLRRRGETGLDDAALAEQRAHLADAREHCDLYLQDGPAVAGGGAAAGAAVRGPAGAAVRGGDGRDGRENHEDRKTRSGTRERKYRRNGERGARGGAEARRGEQARAENHKDRRREGVRGSGTAEDTEDTELTKEGAADRAHAEARTGTDGRGQARTKRSQRNNDTKRHEAGTSPPTPSPARRGDCLIRRVRDGSGESLRGREREGRDGCGAAREVV